MRGFINNDFLLSTKMARKLYHEAAALEPVFDYHCHLVPQEIAENRRFPDLTAVWLGGDHYKWRMLRANGFSEQLITGNADPYDKFLAWAQTVPRLIGNPLYHWTHLELQRYFDIHEPLNPRSAPAIWKAANEQLKNNPELSVFGIFKKFNVFALGTTDDPADTLEWHEKVRTLIKTKILPSFRPDQILNIEKPGFAEYMKKLGAAAGKNISNLDDLLAAIRERINFFDKSGCCISDHDLEFVPFAASREDGIARPEMINRRRWEDEIKEIFSQAMEEKIPDGRSCESWKTYLLNFLGGEYYDRGWVMQLHVGALRSVNSTALKKLGPNTGFDAVHDHAAAEKLSRLLDLLHSAGKLPKTVLYSLNLKDYYPLATIMGCFQDEDCQPRSSAGKMQLGSAWWFLDHLDGMETQMKVLGNAGLLSRFIGMLTDSRSFLSYPRHEYFRRILCNILGNWVEQGEIPRDFALLDGMVRDIAFRNAAQYFNIMKGNAN
ncbi:MAG: glucuronate isomerase [Spirochaetaceae bacterium]|jgi:glucuronate isomerase|nr:glucuronate isomerase [Spirochaetaceae bacterium]